MKRIVKLTESDLTRIVKRTIREMSDDENKMSYTVEDAKNEIDNFIDENSDLDRDELFRELNSFMKGSLRRKMNRANMMGSFTNDDLNEVLNYVRSLKYSYTNQMFR
jgi:glutamyl-tRNA reductase